MRLRKHEQVCVELTDQELRLLWYIPGGHKGNKNMTPVIFEVIPLSQGIIEQGFVRQPTELSRLLEKSRGARGIKGKINARIGITLSNGFIREYTLPWVVKRDRSQLISYLADEEIPIDEEERTIDYFVLEENSRTKQLRVLLSGTRKSILRGIAASFESAGFTIELIGFSAMAWARALQFGAEEFSLLIQEQTGMFQIILYKGQIPVITRAIPFSVRNYGVAEWNLEIQRIYAYFSTLQEQVRIQRVVVSQGAETESLGQRICIFLLQEKGIQPRLQVLEETFTLVPTIENFPDSEKALAVTGMALDKPGTYPNNFWRGREKRKAWERMSWIAAAFLLSLSLIGLGIQESTHSKISNLEQEIALLKQQEEKLSDTKKVQEEQVRVWKELRINPTTVGQDLILLHQLSGNGVNFERLEYKNKSLLVQGNALEPALVQTVFNQLQELGWQKTKLTHYYQTGDRDSKKSLIEFTLTTERVK